jgi:uncharacterized membrane protein HdeD (DUF308 family)
LESVALALPELTGLALVSLFGVYTAVNGITVLTVAFHDKGRPGFGSLLLERLVRFVASVPALAMPGRVALALPLFLEAWAGLSGIRQVAAAVVLRRK